mgnify:CR=1 FL=1|tara:strand:+ start:218 stop:1789 length:1572 start_codon:yes stop_codon:yes gene_type:complete
MEYNLSSDFVKDLNFGEDATKKIVAGVEKLAKAVKSTLGASGKCVIYEDGRGKPVITKDGVTVAESVVLFDPVENIGATLIKEAAQNTVKEAGDGTTTATVLAEALIKNILNRKTSNDTDRQIKEGIYSGLKKVNDYLNKTSIEVDGDTLKHVSAISCNNDAVLGAIIAEAYEKVGKDGVVLMEESESEETYVDVVEGIQLDCGLTSQYLLTNTEKHTSELENPLVLIVSSEIPNVRKIQGVLEHVIKKGRALLIVASLAPSVKQALIMNKVKGNIKVNVVDLPGFGPTKRETIEDLAMLTGATVINEELGDDLDMITPEYLGEAEFSITDANNTVITLEQKPEGLEERIKEVESRMSKEKDGFIKKKLQDRLSMLSGSVGVIKVGANSKVELKEKKDRVEDAIYATKAALKEGIVPGGGVALLNASQNLTPESGGENILFKSIEAPFHTVLENAGLEQVGPRPEKGIGVNVVTGKDVNMIDAGIVDPVLVTKSALKNAVSVVTTIISADCIISNIRINESGK